MTAFKLARKWWVEGRRLNLSAMAEELGVGRATIMRWVGNKELLLGEVLWSIYAAMLDHVKNEVRHTHPNLSGIDYLAKIYHDMNAIMIQAQPLRRFLRQDPKFALHVLTSNVSGIQERLIKTWKEMIEEQIAAGNISPQMDPENIAYFAVRIGEGVVYSDLICGREPVLAPATTAFRLLLSSQGQEQAAKRTTA